MFVGDWALEVWILVLAPLVVVPLGLSLIPQEACLGWERAIRRAATWLHFPAAILFAAAFAIREQGILAAGLAVPWLIVTLLLASEGLLRLRRLGLPLDGPAAVTAALVFVPVGAAWAVISRAGLRPQDFSPAIVLLTAVHFHYAGFALPILASRLAGIRPRTSERVLLGTIIVAIPAVGVGISLSPTIEVVAALALAAACVWLAILQIRYACRIRHRNATPLLLISSASLLSAMILAGVYAVGELTARQQLPIPTMILIHGSLNAFGFAICGLLGQLLYARNSIPRLRSQMGVTESLKARQRSDGIL